MMVLGSLISAHIPLKEVGVELEGPLSLTLANSLVGNPPGSQAVCI